MSDLLTVATTALMLQLKVREDEMDDVLREFGRQEPAKTPSGIVAQVRAAHVVVRDRRIEATWKNGGWL